MRLLDADDPFDFVVLRGLRAVRKVVDNGGFDGRIWTYLTDIPQSLAAMTDEIAADLGRIADASRLMLCQTEELRRSSRERFPGPMASARCFRRSCPPRLKSLSSAGPSMDGPSGWRTPGSSHRCGRPRR